MSRKSERRFIMGKILLNDEIIDRAALIDIEDRGYQFGDGIYEVAGVYGGKLFLLDEHLVRLKRSAKALGITLPFKTETLAKQLTELVETNGIEEGLVYLQVSRGVAPRTHELPVGKMRPVVVAYTKTLGDLTGLQDQGSIAILQDDIRWHRCDIKSLNLLPNTMAKQKAVEADAVEAILHRDGTVTEASSSNVFIVKDGELITHPANNFILNGITRQKLIELAAELELPIREELYSVDDLLAADEVFISATKLDVVPILAVDGKKIGSGQPGPISKKLLAAMREITGNL